MLAGRGTASGISCRMMQRAAEFFLPQEVAVEPIDSRLRAERDLAHDLWVAGEAEEATRVLGRALDKEDDYATLRRELDARLDVRRLDHKQLRNVRILCAAILGVSFLALVYMQATKPPKPPKVVASAQWDARYPASNVIDGSDATDWILPDKTPGDLELTLPKPKHVARIKIVNARNPPYYDRGTQTLRVEAFSGATVVKNEEILFDPPTKAPASRTVEINATIDRVRLTVVTHYLLGGGISEVELESR